MLTQSVRTQATVCSLLGGTVRRAPRLQTRHRLTALVLALLTGVTGPLAHADPISPTPSFFFAGNLDFTVTGGTLRTESNSGNSCAVTNSSTGTLTGVPPGATVAAAYLYWAGSGSTPDNAVRFQSSVVSASRTFSETFNFGTLRFDFFSGFADVTGLVSGNGTYTFSDLTVTNTDQGTTSPYCSRAAVLSGWGMIVIYELLGEPLRVINLFDGFQQFRGSQIQVNPTNFVVPASPIDGRVAILTWEGDVENSTPANGVSENLTFDGASTGPVNLTDLLNPLNNQFNSTINGNGTSTSYGVDFDSYDISSRLRAGDSSATTTYASGGDLVLLSLQVVSTTNTATADLRLSKRLASPSLSNAAPARFGLAVSNAGPSPATGPITLTDTLPAGLAFLGANSADGSWSCSGNTTVTCAHPGPLAVGATLPEAIVIASVDPGISVPITNEATVTSPVFDGNTANNRATLTISSIATPELSTSRKSVVDLDDGDLLPGDTLRYSILIEESAGADLAGLVLDDALDPGLTNPVWVNLAGGTDESAGNQLRVSDLSVPASGSITLVFDAQVIATAGDGDRINNTATLTQAAVGLIQSVTAPEVTVGTRVIPTSGIKPLYFGDIDGSTNNPVVPLTMSRVPLGIASNPERVRIRRQDNNRSWRLAPLLAADLGLDADPIPVRLYLRRNGQTTNRVVRVTLTHGTGNTFIGCSQRTLLTSGSAGLSTSETRPFDFNIERTDANCNPIAGAPLTIPAGSFLSLNVDNSPTGGSGQAIFLYPWHTGANDASGLELPANTIINVDSVAVFDAPGDGNALSAIAAGATVFLRATVSDPFGADDITAARYALFDPSAAQVASGPMAELSADGAIKTYEVPITIPADASNGVWRLVVTADEGTEGSITHTASAPVTVTGGPGLTVEKTLTVLSDGGSGIPKAIPGAEVEYIIRVANTGADPIEADSIFVNDLLPAELRLVLAPGAPVTLVDGSPSSGLTLNFSTLSDPTDDVGFSNNGGSSFITPSVDSEGLDQTVPPIDFLQINPKGVMPGNSGTPPSFELRLRMRIP